MAQTKCQSCRLLAADQLQKQAKQLRRHLKSAATVASASGNGASGNVPSDVTVEGIHQIRVASRRLRAALRVFRECLPAKKQKRWRKKVRRITREFGKARDLDVQIEYLDHARLVADPVYWPGISRLAVKLEKQRERLQPKIVATAERLQTDAILADMRTTLKKIRDKANKKEIGESTQPEPGQPGTKLVRRHVCDRLGELLAHQKCLGDTTDQVGHHAMRVAAKQLRYTLEVARPILGVVMDAPLQATKRVQALLGTIHDCDVSRQRLDAFYKKERKRIDRLRGHSGMFQRLGVGIDHLRRQRGIERDAAFSELVDLWQEFGNMKIDNCEAMR